jgi:hypothetical protein
VYGHETMVPLEFMVPILHVAEITNMIERGAIQERLSQLMEIEEDNILEYFTRKYRKQEINLA